MSYQCPHCKEACDLIEKMLDCEELVVPSHIGDELVKVLNILDRSFKCSNHPIEG